MAKSRGGTRPTGPNAKLQGKPLAPHVAPAREGNENGNGDMKAGGACVEYGIHTAPVRGTRKSF